MSPTYQLETIPLWEAYREASSQDSITQSCPFCQLQKRSEQDFLTFYLGASVMNPENRVAVNNKGFCTDHLKKLLGERKNHGYSLMLHTHLQEIYESHKSLLHGGEGKLATKKAIKKTKELDTSISECLICEGISGRMDRYGATAAHLWKKDSEFRQVFESQYVCLTHLPLLMYRGADMLGGKDFQLYMEAIRNLFTATGNTLESDIHHYTQMYKAENSGKDWGRAEGALERLVNFLGGE